MITLNGDPITITRFPDGTSQVWQIGESHLRYEAAQVYWRFENEAEVMHLAQLALLLERHVPRRNLIIEYLPYGRQDKMVDNKATFALRAFAPLLNVMSWTKITIVDPHSAEALSLIKRSNALYPTAHVIHTLNQIGGGILCFPDKGAANKYATMFAHQPYVEAEKTRDPLTGHLVTGQIHGDVHGKRVLIVDDICDGGATFIGLAAKLREAGATDVCLFVSHGLFTKGVRVLLDAGISRVFTPRGETLP